jgi:hypothetical protein
MHRPIEGERQTKKNKSLPAYLEPIKNRMQKTSRGLCQRQQKVVNRTHINEIIIKTVLGC